MKEQKESQTKIEGIVSRHYYRAVIFLIVTILLGSVFWGIRRYNPALFLGKPDLIAVPNDEQPTQKPNQIKEEIETQQKPLLLNINLATEEELQTLPSIGPQMAKRIVQFRKENSDFKSVNDLIGVKGIGEKTLEKIRPFIDVD
ncbi:helix-hairpin-helix domain-containing protein [Candidatus Poribacteria bacterium]|nr:helix-hairpin-helix domain-containing protein [Candidatus Poribacteria bacterium]